VAGNAAILLLLFFLLFLSLLLLFLLLLLLFSVDSNSLRKKKNLHLSWEDSGTLLAVRLPVVQTLSRQCSDREGWCQTGNPVPWVAAEIMAGQLAESLSGQMNSQFEQLDYLFKLWTKSREDVPSSADVAAAAEMPAVKSLEEKYLRAGKADQFLSN
jgi:hypothetical protein